MLYFSPSISQTTYDEWLKDDDIIQLPYLVKIGIIYKTYHAQQVKSRVSGYNEIQS